MPNDKAREAKVPQGKLDVLAGWSEAPRLYTQRERASIDLTEEMTMISAGGVSDAVWDKATGSFPETEVVYLLMAIAAINVWNRLAISTHQDFPAE